MKIAFSTLGCPEWSWNEICPMAKDLGFDGIEIRGLGNEIHAAHTQPFAPVKEFPMTASGIIQKHLIREWAIENLHLQEAASIETA